MVVKCGVCVPGCGGADHFEDSHGRSGCVFCGCPNNKEVTAFAKQLGTVRDNDIAANPVRYAPRDDHFGHMNGGLQGAWLYCPDKCFPKMAKPMARMTAASHKQNSLARFLARTPEAVAKYPEFKTVVGRMGYPYVS